MTVEFSCPECGKVYTLASQLAGKKARCKQCQTVMIVPGEVAKVEPPPERPPTPVEPPKSSPSPSRRRKSRTRRHEPSSEHLYGIEDSAPLPPRAEVESPSPLAPRSRKGPRRARAFWDNLPQPSFGLFVLAWWVLIIGLVGLSFQVDDGGFKCGQWIAWIGVVLIPTGVIWFYVTAFQEDLTRGVLVLVVPLYNVYHLFNSWSRTSRPFWTTFAGIVSLVSGSMLYGLMGDDVGERSVLSFPGSMASRKVVIQEDELPLRPPEVGAETPAEEAVLHWETFVEAVRNDDRIERLASRKKNAMAAAHGRDKIATVTVDYVMDGARFDEVVKALRSFAGSGPDDFFAYPALAPPPAFLVKNAKPKRNVNLRLIALLAPVHSPEMISRGLTIGRPFSANASSRYILVSTSLDQIPAPLRSLLDAPARAGEIADSTPVIDLTGPPRPEALPTTGDLELIYPRVPGGRVTIYPVATSRYVAIGTNLAPISSRESWDLVERKRIGVITGTVPLFNRITLSPDGRTIAGVAGDQQSVEVWSFETGQLLRKINVPTIVNLVEYAGPDRLLISTPFQKTYYLTDIASGQVLKTIVSPVAIDTDSLAFSPDLRNLGVASTSQKSAGVYSLETAKLIRNWPVPPAQRFSALNCKGMVYSADGTELAGLFEDFEFSRFMVWGDDGKLIADSVVPMNSGNSVAKPTLYTGRPLEWLPDKSGWMVYGRAIVAKATGRVAWWIPPNPDDSKSEPRRILETGELLTVGGSVAQPILRGSRLPLEAIAEAMRSGESPPDPTRSEKAQTTPNKKRKDAFVIPTPGSGNRSSKR